MCGGVYERNNTRRGVSIDGREESGMGKSEKDEAVCSILYIYIWYGHLEPAWPSLTLV